MNSRLKAFATHLASSIFIVSLFFYIVFFVWYPYPYYELHRTNDIAPILAGVDVILGPLITLFIYNTRKPVAELARDISIIVCIQLGALLWGMYTIYSVRPVFNVFINDGFYSVTLEKLDLSKLNSDIKVPGFFQGPKMVFVEYPFKTSEESQQYFVNVLYYGVLDLRYRTQLYEKIDSHRQQVIDSSLSEDAIKNKKSYSLMTELYLGKDNTNRADYLYYPFRREVDEFMYILKPEEIKYVD